MNFKNIRIGKRLGIGFGILGLMMIVLVVAGITATATMNSRLEEIANVDGMKDPIRLRGHGCGEDLAGHHAHGFCAER